jgi:hypothetical protein
MQRVEETYTPGPHTGPPYPGLGLPLRAEPENHQESYPIGAHGSCDGSHTMLLPVRELAMMHIMDRLTDKADWNKKVWDDGIVEKWRVEAKGIADIEWWNIATGMQAEEEPDPEDEDYRPYMRHRCQLEGVVNDNTFDCVSVACRL